MDNLMEYICDELEEIDRKAEKDGKLTMAELQYADTLAHMKKNLLTAEEKWEESDYSEAGGGSYRGYSRRGSSYEGGRGGQGGGTSNRGGSYARGGGGGRGQNARRDSMGRYSGRSNYSYGSDDMVEELRELMQDAPDERTRQEFEQFIRKIEKM